MDVKDMITDLVEKITKDEDLKEQFEKEPVKAIEKLVGKDLPDDIVEKIIDGVKAKISVDKVSDALGSLKKLF